MSALGGAKGEFPHTGTPCSDGSTTVILYLLV
jgi:hypothetical protein